MYGFSSFSETPFATLNTFFGEVSDAITLTALEDASFQYNVLIDESISFSASQQAATAFGEVSVVENIGIYDFQSVTAQFASAVAEALGVTDSQNVTVVFVGATAETISITDLQTGSFAFYATTEESIGLTAAQNVLAIFAKSVAESIAMTESASARADFVGTVVEQVNLVDQPCAFGWFSINDDQAPDWGFITVDVNEVAAYGAFTFGGVPFAGSYSISGVYPNPLPSEQEPNWTDINNGAATTWNEIDNSQNC